MKKKYLNTLQKGAVRYIVFKEADIWYAVGLEFNIVESGDDPDEVLFDLFEAIRGYVESLRKIRGVRPDVLNQRPDPEYEKLWNELQEHRKTEVPVHTFGHQRLIPAMAT